MAEVVQLIAMTAAAAAAIATLAFRYRASSTGVPGPGHGFSNPSVKDVLQVKRIIQKASGMPLELIDEVIDLAEYWPCSTVKTFGDQYAVGSVVKFDHRDDMCNTLVLRSLPLGYHSEMAMGTRPTKIERTSYQAAYPLSPWQNLSFFESDTPFVADEWAGCTLPRGKNPCRKVVFTIHSSDQGWGGSTTHHGTYRGSYTWFDVGLERFIPWNCNEFETSPRLDYSLLTILPQTITDKGSAMLDHPFLPPATRLQTNLLARSETTKHVITWSSNDHVEPDSVEGDELEEQGRGSASMTGEYVRSLKLGDVITVWARARFPRWRNNVEEVRMDVFWAV